MQLVQEVQQQHEQEVAALLKDKDQQLQKDTAATLTGEKRSHSLPERSLSRSLYEQTCCVSSAIAAMRRAQKLEPGKNLHTQEDVDVTQLHDGDE